MKEVKKLLLGFMWAGRGFLRAVKTQRNLRIHLVAVLVILVFNAMAGFSALHWVLELLCCMLVISLELVNTALEALCDAVMPEYHSGIGFAKDAAAGAVLVSAIGSVIAALIIFFSDKTYGNHIVNLFQGYPLLWAGLVLLVLLAVCFVFYPCVKKERERKE